MLVRQTNPRILSGVSHHPYTNAWPISRSLVNIWHTYIESSGFGLKMEPSGFGFSGKMLEVGGIDHPFHGNHLFPRSKKNTRSTKPLSGWWFGTMEFYDFPFSWECHHPNWRTPSLFRGVGLNHQPACLVGGLEHVLFFHSVGNNTPIWLISLIFFRGVGQPPTSHLYVEKNQWDQWNISYYYGVKYGL